MINLMPYDTKKEIRSARLNVILGRYIIVVLLAFGFLALLLAGSYVVLTQTKESAQRLIDIGGSNSNPNGSTESQVRALNSTLSQAGMTLNQGVSYSDTLINIGQQMPAGTVLDSLTLNAASFGSTPITLKVYAKTTDDITALQQKFQSTPDFENVKVIPDTASINGYPVSASVTFIITKAVAQ